jgi:hypothetical protein
MKSLRCTARKLGSTLVTMVACTALHAAPTISFTRPPTPTVTTNGQLHVDFAIANPVPNLGSYLVTFSTVNPTNGPTSVLDRRYYPKEGTWSDEFSLPCLNPEHGWRIRADVESSSAYSAPFSEGRLPCLNFQSLAISNLDAPCLTNAANVAYATFTNEALFGTNDTIFVYCALNNIACEEARQCSLLLQFVGSVTNSVGFPLANIPAGAGLNWSTNLSASSFPAGHYGLTASIDGGNDTGHGSAKSSFVVVSADTVSNWCTNRPAPPHGLHLIIN